jgi:hypothetical protein
MATSYEIAQGWRDYAERNDLRSGTKKYENAQHAFVIGCNTILGEEGLPPIIQIYVMCGRDIADLKQEAVA